MRSVMSGRDFWPDTIPDAPVDANGCPSAILADPALPSLAPLRQSRVDMDDYADFEACPVGPDGGLGTGCECFNFDDDGDTDLRDFAVLVQALERRRRHSA